MRIGLDARYLTHALTGGVHTYVRNLALELPRCAPDDEFVYYVDEKAPLDLPTPPANVQLRRMRWRGPLDAVRNDLSLGGWFDRDRLDVAHCPANYGPRCRVPLVVTLHDTLNLFPMRAHLGGFSRRPRQVAMMLYLGRMTRATLSRASRLIAVSEHARQDIATRTGYPLHAITTIHEAAAPPFRPITDRRVLDECRLRHALDGDVVLADGIKNPGVLLDAIALLPDAVGRRTRLVFFSREATPRPAVRAALTGGLATFVPRPTDEELAVLMNLAAVFVLPSWYEGFGLPLVEAMQCGTPVIASSRAAMPEIVGDAGLIFDVDRPEALARHLASVLTSRAERDRLASRAVARARQFSWDRAARETLAVYVEAASAARRAAQTRHRGDAGEVRPAASEGFEA